jgi:hypothetical protein
VTLLNKIEATSLLDDIILGQKIFLLVDGLNIVRVVIGELGIEVALGDDIATSVVDAKRLDLDLRGGRDSV